MDRRLNPEILIDYHFGTLEGPARAEVEEALLTSEESLRAYLRLKRELDGVHPVDQVPSPAAKARLRSAVEQEVRPQQPARPRRTGRGILAVLWRPVPLYQTLAVAAAVAVLVGILGLSQRTAGPELAPARPAMFAGAPTVDFARPNPLGMDLF